MSGRFFNNAGPVDCAKHYCLDPLARINADAAPSTVNLGHTYLLQGDRERASHWYERTIPLVPDERALRTGPLADSDPFMERGWQAVASREEQAWFEKAAVSAIPG